MDDKAVTEDRRALWGTHNPRVLKSNSILKPLQFHFSTGLKQQFQDMYSLAAGYPSTASFDRRALAGGGSTSRVWDDARTAELAEVQSEDSRIVERVEDDPALANFRLVVGAWRQAVEAIESEMKQHEAEISPMVPRELPPVESPDVQQIRVKMDSRLVEKNLPIHIYEARTQYDSRQPYEHLKAAAMLSED